MQAKTRVDSPFEKQTWSSINHKTIHVQEASELMVMILDFILLDQLEKKQFFKWSTNGFKFPCNVCEFEKIPARAGSGEEGSFLLGMDCDSCVELIQQTAKKFALCNIYSGYHKTVYRTNSQLLRWRLFPMCAQHTRTQWSTLFQQ